MTVQFIQSVYKLSFYVDIERNETVTCMVKLSNGKCAIVANIDGYAVCDVRTTKHGPLLVGIINAERLSMSGAKDIYHQFMDRPEINERIISNLAYHPVIEGVES